MADENKPDELESEKIKLERFKEWRKIITVSVSVVFGSALIGVLNYQVQNKQLEQQDKINEAQLIATGQDQ